MNGVVILEEVSVRGAELSHVVLAWFAFIFFVLCMLDSVLVLWRIPYRGAKVLAATFTAILVIPFLTLILLMALDAHVDYQTFYTEYTVTVDDSVEFNEFYNRYEIISQNGDIYTVREVDE